MSSDPPETCLTAFAGFQRIASGTRADVAAALQAWRGDAPPLVFDDATGALVDLDRDAQFPTDAPPALQPRRVGRPRLGVVAREVTLLPRHWDWLSRQPGGASVALRKLIDEARRVHGERDAVRAAREAAYRFMSAIAGDLPGFEEAARALFAGQHARFEALVVAWPEDVAAYLRTLSDAGWAEAA